jgi:hypothetical protein
VSYYSIFFVYHLLVEYLVQIAHLTITLILSYVNAATGIQKTQYDYKYELLSV